MMMFGALFIFNDLKKRLAGVGGRKLACQLQRIPVCFVSKKDALRRLGTEGLLLFLLLKMLVSIGGKLVVSLVGSWLFNLLVIRELG